MEEYRREKMNTANCCRSSGSIEKFSNERNARENFFPFGPPHGTIHQKRGRHQEVIVSIVTRKSAFLKILMIYQMPHKRMRCVFEHHFFYKNLFFFIPSTIISFFLCLDRAECRERRRPSQSKMKNPED